MDKKDLKIVYMGTPDFAVESLKRLVEGGYNVAAVVTMPDKPAGRGRKVVPSAVKVYATQAGLKVLQPERLKDESFIDELKGIGADLQIVVAFRMLPEVVWNMPRLGTFNLHASLLPQYRGAAPINWSIINGDKETGVTTFFLKHEIDTGEIIDRVAIPIGDDDDAGTVHDRLMMLGAELVVRTVDRILEGHVETRPQEALADGETLRPAPKIFKDTCHIDWHDAAENIRNLVRGLSPYPCAWGELHVEGKEPLAVKIYAVRKSPERCDAPCGTVDTDGKTYLRVAAANGWVEIVSLQLPGKKRMTAEELLRGHKLDGGYFS